MGRIVVLDQNMVNMIAAGEVIERPASVVKELVENSIDAGATKITIAVEDGGRKLISVTDNGCGMDAEDLSSAFEPHTTSKIRTSDDLRAISTLGFRGEALASIASIAQIKAVSRTNEQLAGNFLEIDCGSKGPVAPCSADIGTTIQVRDLFYKLPARRKFLKTANTEITHVIEQFIRIALASPEHSRGGNTNIELALTHNGRDVYRISKEQSIRSRIAELFSPDVADNLLETQSEEKGLQIRAYLGMPAIAATSNRLQYIFLNGRFIRDKFISHAIKEAYRGAIDPSRFPAAFLFIQMPPEDFDVNVHPTKIEVRFFNANLVHSQILACLREKLLSTDIDTLATAPRQQETSPVRRDSRIAEAMEEFFKRHRPQSQRNLDFSDTRYLSPDTAIKTENRASSIENRASKFLQIHDSFIIAETDDGLVIIDQHALHERIMYEHLKKRVGDNPLESQKLLVPESLQLTGTQTDILENNAELLEKLGIEIVPFGPKTIAIQSFPVLLAKAQPVDFLRDVIDLIIDKEESLDGDSLLDEVLHMAACKAAIKAGTKLTDAEIEQLIADKDTVENSSHCPHGRPTVLKFTLAELEKQFKRT
jgi:DNA mismatch repair protein MutL